MSSFIAVIPYVWEPFKLICEQSMSPRFRESTLFIDNTVNNIGIMKSYNQGVEILLAEQRDWILPISAAIKFGEPGGDDFLHILDTIGPEHKVVEALGVYGWHLIAFRREVVERIGGWDENFTPYGFDDIDYSIRYQIAYNLSGLHQLWNKHPVDVDDKHAGMGHSIHYGGVKADPDRQIEYFKWKWGRHPGDYQLPYYRHPFNDPTKPLSWWPKGWMA